MNRILIIEDEELIRHHTARLLTRNGYEVRDAGTVAEAEVMGLRSFDLIISDVRLPGTSGTEVIARAHPVPVIIMTSYASVRAAVECMHLGARDYISKPFDHDEMLLVVERVLGSQLLARQNAALKQDVDRSFPIASMVGECAAMQQVLDRVRRVAATDVTLLIRGESGTGKELVARAVHESGRRRDGPFIAVNCAAIPENLVESELFGFEKGAFTGAVRSKDGLFMAAHGGTLFLDEIGELAQPVQAHLLRVLQEGEVRAIGANRSRKVDVRLLAATHRDLEQMMREGHFREDLYYRLRVMEITLPPLRERGADIDRLAAHLLSQATARLGRSGLRLSRAAQAAIHGYPWPGNVRELANALERAVILCDGPQIEPEHLAIPVQAPGSAAAAGESLDDYFRSYVLEHQGRMTEASIARALGISRKTLWKRRGQMNLPR